MYLFIDLFIFIYLLLFFFFFCSVMLYMDSSHSHLTVNTLTVFHNIISNQIIFFSLLFMGILKLWELYDTPYINYVCFNALPVTSSNP